MPITFKELDGGLGNLIKGSGTITDEEYIRVMEEHASKPESQLRKYVYSISDYIDVTKADISFNSLYKVSLLMNRIYDVNPDAIIAIAASGKPYNLVKIWSLLLSFKGWTIKVFKDRKTLDGWLDGKLNSYDSSIKFNFDKS